MKKEILTLLLLIFGFHTLFAQISDTSLDLDVEKNTGNFGTLLRLEEDDQHLSHNKGQH